MKMRKRENRRAEKDLYGPCESLAGPISDGSGQSVVEDEEIDDDDQGEEGEEGEEGGGDGNGVGGRESEGDEDEEEKVGDEEGGNGSDLATSGERTGLLDSSGDSEFMGFSVIVPFRHGIFR